MNSVVTKLSNYFSSFFLSTARLAFVSLMAQIPFCDLLLIPWKRCNPENYVYSLKISENHCTWWWMDCRYGRRKMRCNNGSWKQNLNSIVCYKVRCPWSNISKKSAGFPKAKNVWNHDGTGRVVLLFSKPDETRSTSFWNYFSNEENYFTISFE